MKAFTDYPFEQLGDTSGQKAPVRACVVVAYDQNKYCHIKVAGVMQTIKRGYIYPISGRCGDIDSITEKDLEGYPDMDDIGLYD